MFISKDELARIKERIEYLEKSQAQLRKECISLSKLLDARTKLMVYKGRGAPAPIAFSGCYAEVSLVEAVKALANEMEVVIRYQESEPGRIVLVPHEED